MLSEAAMRAGNDSGQVGRVLFIAHGRALGGVDGQGDGLLGANLVRDATHVLALGGLGAVAVQGSDHIEGSLALGLRLVADWLWTSVAEQIICAQVFDNAFLNPGLTITG